MPDVNLNGAASVCFLKSDEQLDLKFHVADHESLVKHYVLDEDVSNYLRLMKFVFQNFLETNMRLSILLEINKNNEFFQVFSFEFYIKAIMHYRKTPSITIFQNHSLVR